MDGVTVGDGVKFIKFNFKDGDSAVSTFWASRNCDKTLYIWGFAKVFTRIILNLWARYFQKCAEKSSKITSKGLMPVRGLAENI